MNVKQLLKDYQLKKAALLLAEQRRQLRENPGDELALAQAIGMTQMAYEVFNVVAFETLYNYYCHKLDQSSLPKPGQTAFYYDPLEDYTPKLAKVIESSDWPKWVRIKLECDNTTFDVTDRDIYLLLYW